MSSNESETRVWCFSSLCSLFKHYRLLLLIGLSFAGKSDVSDEEPESEESDDEPLASKTKNGRSSPLDVMICRQF